MWNKNWNNLILKDLQVLSCERSVLYKSMDVHAEQLCACFYDVPNIIVNNTSAQVFTNLAFIILWL